MNAHHIFDYVAGWIAMFSVINLLLPPYEFFDGYPRFQGIYKLIVKIVGYYGALNLRGTIANAYNQRRAALNGSDTSTPQQQADAQSAGGK